MQLKVKQSCKERIMCVVHVVVQQHQGRMPLLHSTDSKGRFNYNTVCWSISITNSHIVILLAELYILTKAAGQSRYNGGGQRLELAQIAAFNCRDLSNWTRAVWSIIVFAE